MHKFIGHCVIYTVTSCHLHHCCQTLGFKKIFSMSVVVDYAGPLAVKHYAHSSYPKALTLGKPNAHISYGGKVWVCLFTWVFCAIHFEIATDITPLSFIRCFKRFVSRRGLPTQIISDNGTAFRIAAKTIRNIFKHPKVQNYLCGINVKWIVNIEWTPWCGGFSERMVQLLRRCLRKMVRQAKPMY